MAASILFGQEAGFVLSMTLLVCGSPRFELRPAGVGLVAGDALAKVETPGLPRVIPVKVVAQPFVPPLCTL